MVSIDSGANLSFWRFGYNALKPLRFKIIRANLFYIQQWMTYPIELHHSPVEFISPFRY